jgi:hypothetical protein
VFVIRGYDPQEPGLARKRKEEDGLTLRAAILRF